MNPQALSERALAEPADRDSRWSYVMALHRLGSEETFWAAVELCRSDEPARRALGADILGQLGTGKPLEERPYRTAAVEVLLQALAHEGDPSVLHSLGAAFGHLDDPRCIPALQKLRHHPDAGTTRGEKVVPRLLAATRGALLLEAATSPRQRSALLLRARRATALGAANGAKAVALFNGASSSTRARAAPY